MKPLSSRGRLRPGRLRREASWYTSGMNFQEGTSAASLDICWATSLSAPRLNHSWHSRKTTGRL